MRNMLHRLKKLLSKRTESSGVQNVSNEKDPEDEIDKLLTKVARTRQKQRNQILVIIDPNKAHTEESVLIRDVVEEMNASDRELRENE